MPRIIEVDPDDKEQIRAINQLAVYAFHPSPSKEELTDRLDIADNRRDSRQFLLYDDNQPVATSTIHPLTQHVRGRIVNVGGVATIGSMPTHRNRGHVSQLMSRMLTTMKEDQQHLSALHPFKESFYHRYGYMTLPDRMQVKLEPTSLLKVRNIELDDISYELQTLEECLNAFIRFRTQVQQSTPGMIAFSNRKWKDWLIEENWILSVKSGRDIIAMVVYTMRGHSKPLDVEFIGWTSSKGKYALLQYLANHIDHSSKINLPVRFDQQIENWLDDLATFERSFSPGAMIRVVSVNGLNELRLKVGSDVRSEGVVLQITDEQCEWNTGTFKFKSQAGILLVEQVNEDAQAVMTIDVLSGLIFGYYDLSDLRVKGKYQADPPVDQELTKLFPPVVHELQLYF